VRVFRSVSGLCVTACLLALWSVVPDVASAGGFELSGAGTRPLGRGGAFAARADDGLALLYNPAMLADLTESQVTLNAGLAIWDACVSRPGTYQDAIGGPGAAPTGDTIFNRPGPNPDSWLANPFPTVCNSGPPQVLPQIIGSVRISPEFTLAFGILAPNGVGASQWGGSDGTVTGADGGSVPSPTRYALTDASLLLFHPSVGFGWRPLDWLRVGATFQWGVGIIGFTNYTNIGAQFEDPHDDVRTHLSVVDPFVPAAILSVHIVPHDNFDIMVGARFSDAIGGAADASGDLTLTSGVYGTSDPAGMAPLTPTQSTVPGARLQSGQPFSFTAAFRYGHRLRPRAYTRPGDAGLRPGPDDPMADELFDLELDIVYELNSQVGDFVVSTPPGSEITIQNTGGGLSSVPVPSPLPIPHGWRDNVVLRLGGDVNVIPGVLAFRAGLSYDQPIDQTYVRYVINDFIQGWRVGLHVGGTVRIDNHLDISLAYAHYFAETIVVDDPSFRVISATGVQGICPPGHPGATTPPGEYQRSVVSTGCYPEGFGNAVNGGTYTQQFNLVSLSATYHFD
jgi:long-subunit fatty acid transport protein